MTQHSDGTVGCACGAHSATRAALRQMSNAEKMAFWQRVRKCETCKLDKRRRK